MKINKSWLAVFTFMTVIALTITTAHRTEAADSEKTSLKEVKKETRELARTLGAYSVNQRDKAIKETREALDDLDKRIEVLETRIDKNWDKMDKAARQEARAGLKALRKQRNTVAEWYGGMKNSTADAWDQTKKGFSDAYQQLYKTWQESEEEFSSK